MNIFITGHPGCGKSTLIKRLLAELSGQKVSGIITPEIRAEGERKGFKIIDLGSGREEILAAASIESGPRVSKYRVNLEGIDRIMDQFLESTKHSEFVVIDEIGTMEVHSKKFRDIVEMIIRSDKTVVATLSRRLVRKYKDRGEVFDLTRDNFDEVYSRVRSRIGR